MIRCTNLIEMSCKENIILGPWERMSCKLGEQKKRTTIWFYLCAVAGKSCNSKKKKNKGEKVSCWNKISN